MFKPPANNGSNSHDRTDSQNYCAVANYSYKYDNQGNGQGQRPIACMAVKNLLLRPRRSYFLARRLLTRLALILLLRHNLPQFRLYFLACL
jgi:hypothetical protein